MSTNEIEKLAALVGTNPEWFKADMAQALTKATEKTTAPHAEEAYKRMKTFAQRQGWTVRDTDPTNLPLDTLGETRYREGTISITPHINSFRKAIVMAHELAHTVHGPQPSFMQASNEIFAESVSFLVADAFGWPTDIMGAYLSYGAGAKRIAELQVAIRTLGPVSLKVARRLMDEAKLSSLVAA